MAALEAGKLGCAALDVFEHEPKVPQALIATDNAVLLPHIGSATLETRLDMENLMLENLKSYFDTGRVITPVE
ncbi:Glyoxylate/hydroxypyruvate reductase B [compost metagenome]